MNYLKLFLNKVLLPFLLPIFLLLVIVFSGVEKIILLIIVREAHIIMEMISYYCWCSKHSIKEMLYLC